MKTAVIIPKSKKSKNRFCNLIQSIDEVIIEQSFSDKVFVTSKNGKYHFWVSLIEDKDWDIKF